jgi:hypothetical protein
MFYVFKIGVRHEQSDVPPATEEKVQAKSPVFSFLKGCPVE